MRTPQENELIRLIQKGFPFEITVHKKRKRPGLLGFLKAKESYSETLKFVVKELTLYKLDRIAIEALSIDEEDLGNSHNLSASIRNKRYFKTMANIVAIATAKDESEEQDLADIFLRSLSARELNQLIEMIDLAGNMPDFISSILSVTSVKKERIESQESPVSQAPTDSVE